jgi:hypothetical protein
MVSRALTSRDFVLLCGTRKIATAKIIHDSLHSKAIAE